jgi:flagellar FliL protein
MADNETKKEAGGGAKASGGGGGGGKLLVILVGVNLLLSGGALAVSLLKKPAAAHPAPAAEGAAAEHGEKAADGHGEAKGEHKGEKGKPELPGPTVKLPDFVVHLRDPEVDRYARLTVEIEVADEKAKEALTARLPHVRDSFIAYLSDRSTADLRGSDAIAKAKSELAERLKQAAPSAPVRGLFFTELVVQ